MCDLQRKKSAQRIRAMPAVSVLTVFHRDTPFLRPAISSVFRQAFMDWQLVLVDNGCGLPAEALAEWERDPRVRWVRLPENRGIAEGLNAGIKAATGEFVAVFDYDDIMLPQRLPKQVDWLRRDSTCALVGSGATIIDEQDRAVGREFCLLESTAHRVCSAFCAGAIGSSWMGRTEVFRRFLYRPEFRCAADFDFVTRVAERHVVAAIPEILLRYRRHGDQTTAVHRVAQIVEECYVRLLTTRRRHGRDENFAAIAEEMAARKPSNRVSDVHREFGRRFLAERSSAQAVYQARRLVVTGGGMSALVEATRVFGAALKASPRDAAFLSRLFFTGPIRAHGFRDQGARLAEVGN
jgi:glycosyltransferase involved in cell wall biosynthesis